MITMIFGVRHSYLSYEEKIESLWRPLDELSNYLLMEYGVELRGKIGMVLVIADLVNLQLKG
jgi:hypothetical protein